MVKINKQLLLRHAAIVTTDPIPINSKSNAATAHAISQKNNQLRRANRQLKRANRLNEEVKQENEVVK